MDQKILEYRLINRESVLSGSSISKCANRLYQLFNLVKNSSNDVTETIHEAFIREILLYKFELTKYAQSHNVCHQEVLEFVALGEEIEKNIESTQKRIEYLSEELQQQKKLRQHKEECEMMARVVNTIPTRSFSNVEITQVDEAMKKVNDQLLLKEAHEKIRIKQVALLMQSIADLYKSFEEDEILSNAQLQAEFQVDEEDKEGDDNGEMDDRERDEERGAREGGRGERQQNKKQRTEGEFELPSIGEDEVEYQDAGGEVGGGDGMLVTDVTPGEDEVQVQVASHTESDATSNLQMSSSQKVAEAEEGEEAEELSEAKKEV